MSEYKWKTLVIVYILLIIGFLLSGCTGPKATGNRMDPDIYSFWIIERG